MIKPRYWWSGSDLLSAFLSATLSEYKQICQDQTPQMLRSCSSPSRKTFIDPQACRSTRRWRFFRYTDAKKYYLLPDCLDRLCLAGYTQSGDGRSICLFCSDPIPPVAVATDQPAKHVPSRSAGGNGISQAAVLRT